MTDKQFCMFLYLLADGDREKIAAACDYAEAVQAETRKAKVARPRGDHGFEDIWCAYGRKGAKSVAFNIWNDMSAADRSRAAQHVPFYVNTRDPRYRKAFERYLDKKEFLSPVYDEGGNIVFDPDIAVPDPAGTYSEYQ